MKDGRVTVEVYSRAAEEEEFRHCVPGRLSLRNGFRTLVYREPGEDGVCVRLTLLPAGVRLFRRGSTLDFETSLLPGVRTESVYRAVGLAFPTVTETEICEVKEEEKVLSLRIRYKLTIGGAERIINFSLKAREGDIS